MVQCVPKATVVEAKLLTHVNGEDIAKWVAAEQWHIETVGTVPVGFFYTPEGLLHIAVGDVVVNTVDNGFERMSPAVFFERYDIVN